MRTGKKGTNWVQLWKRNAVVAAVALFVCAAVYLNWSYDQQAQAGKTLGQSTMVGGQSQDPLLSQETDASAGDTSTAAPAQETAPQAALPEKPARKALPKKEPQQALPKKEEKQALPEKEKQHALPQKPEQTALPKKEDKAALTAPPQPKALTGRKKASKRKKRS